MTRMALTAAQLGIWIGQQLDPANPAYWTAEALHLRGNLERSAFAAAVRQAIAEAETLHLRFASDGNSVWQSCEYAPWQWQEIDFRHAASPMAAAQAWMEQDLRQRPNLQYGPLFGAALLQLAPEHHLWYLRAHHIALDGYGHALLTARIGALYEAACLQRSAPPPRHTGLAQLLAQDQAYQASGARSADQAFWQQRLAGAAAPTLLAPATPLAHQVRRQHAQLPAASMAGWQALAATGQIDTATLLQTALLAWLAATTGQTGLRCGLPQMLRLGSCAVNLPCMAMNIVPLCITLDPAQSLLQAAHGVRAELHAMRAHQRYRHEHMKHDMQDLEQTRQQTRLETRQPDDSSGQPRSSGREQRLFGVVLNWMPFDRPTTLAAPGPHAIVTELLTVASGPVEDLAINLKPQPDGSMQLALEANPDAYSAACLQALLTSLSQTLNHLQAQPDAPLHQIRIDTAALQAAHASPLQAGSGMASGPLPGHQAGLQSGLPPNLPPNLPQDLPPNLPATPALAVLQGALLERPAQDVVQAFIERARARPAQCALMHQGKAMSYADLLQAVQAVAAQLQQQGASPCSLVACMLPRSPEAVISMLAILWTGAAFLPLDPAGPMSRSDTVLAQAQPLLGIATPQDAERFAPHCRVLCLQRRDQGIWQLVAAVAPGHGITTPAADTAPDDAATFAAPVTSADDTPAYVIYTSGSTGHPNGVMIGRAALAHFVAAIGSHYGLTPKDHILQFAPLHFDACIEEIFGTLCHGATLILRHDAMLDSLLLFLQACDAMAISVLDLPTAFWHELAYCISEGQARLPACVRLVIIGGEAALPERLARWRASVPSHVVLQNTYGPTETTVICSSAALAGPDCILPAASIVNGEAGPLPIGRPLPGVLLAVVDDNGQPCATGTAGQLQIAGPTLALGYLAQPALSARRFRALPALPQAPRWYQSGDRVVLGQDGQLRYLGRLDDEFKISGHRIDPLEIETTLLQYPGMLEAAVVAVKRPHGAAPLVLAAFVVLPDGAQCHGAALREFLAQSLPAPALPASFSPMARLPRNQNGKIDRNALRQQATSAQQAEAGSVATALEQRIMAVWHEVLGQPATPQDDFFMLGGKSLQAIQCANRLSVALQHEVAVSTLFRHPVLADLAQVLGTASAAALAQRQRHAKPATQADSDVGHVAPPLASGAEFAPLLSIQRGSGPTLFCLHPAEGLSWCYLGLAAHLPPMPIMGIQARGMQGELPADIDAMLSDYLKLMRSTQPQGPYYLLGWSSGGGIAHALATRLQAAGERVAMLALMDAYPGTIWEGKPPPQERDALVALLDVIGASQFDANGEAAKAEVLMQRLLAPGSTLAYAGQAQLQRICQSALHTMRLYRDLQHQPFQGDLLFFHATQRPADAPDFRQWQALVRGTIERIDIDSTHNGMSQRAPLGHIGRELARRLGSVVPATLEAA